MDILDALVCGRATWRRAAFGRARLLRFRLEDRKSAGKHGISICRWFGMPTCHCSGWTTFRNTLPHPHLPRTPHPHFPCHTSVPAHICLFPTARFPRLLPAPLLPQLPLPFSSPAQHLPHACIPCPPLLRQFPMLPHLPSLPFLLPPPRAPLPTFHQDGTGHVCVVVGHFTHTHTHHLHTLSFCFQSRQGQLVGFFGM